MQPVSKQVNLEKKMGLKPADNNFDEAGNTTVMSIDGLWMIAVLTYIYFYI